MSLEGAARVYAGVRAGSVSLTGWALSSAVEGLAGVIVVWHLTGRRAHSATSDRRAQQAMAVSFWLLAPYVAVQGAHDPVAARRSTADSSNADRSRGNTTGLHAARTGWRCAARLLVSSDVGPPPLMT